MEAFLEAKRARTTESTRSKAARILSSQQYSKWAAADIEKALNLIEDEGKADIFVSLEGDMRDNWLKRKIASL
jgi:DNA-binding HxlR family transcriptional regulator